MMILLTFGAMAISLTSANTSSDSGSMVGFGPCILDIVEEEPIFRTHDPVPKYLPAKPEASVAAPNNLGEYTVINRHGRGPAVMILSDAECQRRRDLSHRLALKENAAKGSLNHDSTSESTTKAPSRRRLPGVKSSESNEAPLVSNCPKITKSLLYSHGEIFYKDYPDQTTHSKIPWTNHEGQNYVTYVVDTDSRTKYEVTSIQSMKGDRWVHVYDRKDGDVKAALAALDTAQKSNPEYIRIMYRRISENKPWVNEADDAFMVGQH